MPKTIDNEQAQKFMKLFTGNKEAHYIRNANGAYLTVDSGITLDDVLRHLSGIHPSILTIPIDDAGLSHVGFLDVDRHEDFDEAVDLARSRQTNYGAFPAASYFQKQERQRGVDLFIFQGKIWIRYGDRPASDGALQTCFGTYWRSENIPQE
jgi:hypothetical protein